MLQSDDTVADLITAATETRFCRFPIVDGDLDETIGIVHVKQVFGVPPAQRCHHPAGVPRPTGGGGALDATTATR